MPKHALASIVPLRRLPSQLREFTYRVPENLTSSIGVGSLVRIPFKQSLIAGVVTQLSHVTTKDSRLKVISASTPIVLTKAQLALAKYLADFYYQSPAVIFNSILAPLPAKLNIPGHQEVRELPQQKRAAHSLEAARSYVLYTDYRALTSVLIAAIRSHKGSAQMVIVTPEHTHRKIVLAALEKIGKLRGALVMPSKQKRQLFYGAWQHSRQAKIIVGSQHALFLPFRRLEQIIIIEAEHQQFQKAEQNPRYHLADYIFHLCELYGASLTLTGFSPDIRLLVAAQERKISVKRAGVASSHYAIIDMRSERTVGNYSFISTEAEDSLQKSKGRALVLYNRHGYARLTVCDDCGFRAECNACGKQLVFDNAYNTLYCPSCGFTRAVYLTCPRCQSTALKFKGSGLSRVKKELQKLFPKRTIVEFSSKSSDSPQRARAPKADITITTNKIFSTLHDDYDIAVVVNADFDLMLPNYHAAESFRHYMHKLRSSSRRLYIQTFSPNHYVFSTLDDVQKFYRSEISWRKQLSYPPFGRIVKVFVRDADKQSYEGKLKEVLERLSSFTFFGPFQRHTARIYYASIIIKDTAQRRAELDAVLAASYNMFHVEINPYELL